MEFERDPNHKETKRCITVAIVPCWDLFQVPLQASFPLMGSYWISEMNWRKIDEFERSNAHSLSAWLCKLHNKRVYIEILKTLKVQTAVSGEWWWVQSHKQKTKGNETVSDCNENKWAYFTVIRFLLEEL